MRQRYKDLGTSLGGHRCVAINSYDKCLSGPLGEIWDKGDGSYYSLELTKQKDEKIKHIQSKDLQRAVLRLKIPSNPKEQLFWANNPNERLK